jgi:transcriptional regulator with XRE-family HTH domain
MSEAEAIRVQFGRNLRRMRSLAGLSQAELGGLLGVSFQQVQKYESGQDNVTLPTLCRLKASLGCELADLLAGVGGSPAEFAVGVEAAAVRRRQRLVFRLTRAVLAIHDPEVQERLIYLARAVAGEP